MFNKKLLLMVGLFVASFVVINVGMFFFLKATQPKTAIHPAAPVAEHAAADSLAHAEAVHSDSTATDSASTSHAEIAAADHAAPESPRASAVAPKPEPAVPVTPPVAEKTAEKTAAVGESEVPTAAAVAAALNGDAREMAKLAKLLEAMKPEAAADIVSHLTTDEIVTLVMKMKDRSAGRMLAALPVEQAARVAERMSQTASRARGGS